MDILTKVFLTSIVVALVGLIMAKSGDSTSSDAYQYCSVGMLVLGFGVALVSGLMKIWTL